MSKIAVLIPCYNEGTTIGKVVVDFRSELPEADIYVYDMSGKLLRGESVKNQNGVWRTPVSHPGVYFVRVNNALGQQTLRAIVK